MLNNLKQPPSHWDNIAKSTKLYNAFLMLRLYIYQLFTFKQQIPKFCKDTLLFPNLWKFMVYFSKLWKKCNSHKKNCFLGQWSRSNNFVIWPFFCQTWFVQTWMFPRRFYLVNFILSEICYIFIKNWQSY